MFGGHGAGGLECRDDLEVLVTERHPKWTNMHTPRDDQTASAGLAEIQERETQRHFQKDRHSFPFQGDRSPHHPKDRHSDPLDTRTDTQMPPRCPLESPLPPACSPPALLSLLSQAVPA